MGLRASQVDKNAVEGGSARYLPSRGCGGTGDVHSVVVSDLECAIESIHERRDGFPNGSSRPCLSKVRRPLLVELNQGGDKMPDGNRIAGIDVHKAMLVVVVVEGTSQACRVIARAKFGAMESELRRLAAWLAERQVGAVVMESTAQYWKPVWMQLEGQLPLYLAQAQSNRAPRGRKSDFRDAERLARRHLAGELEPKSAGGG